LSVTKAGSPPPRLRGRPALSTWCHVASERRRWAAVRRRLGWCVLAVARALLHKLAFHLRLPLGGYAVASMVDSIRKHKKFKQLASYSIQCLEKVRW